MTNHSIVYLDPAAAVIDKLGGVGAVAEITGLSKVQIYRWTQPIAKGGTGGTIPRWHQQDLLAYALIESIDLSPRDFDSPLNISDDVLAAVRGQGACLDIAHRLEVRPTVLARWIANCGDDRNAPTDGAEEWRRISVWAAKTKIVKGIMRRILAAAPSAARSAA